MTAFNLTASLNQGGLCENLEIYIQSPARYKNLDKSSQNTDRQADRQRLIDLESYADNEYTHIKRLQRILRGVTNEMTIFVYPALQKKINDIEFVSFMC